MDLNSAFLNVSPWKPTRPPIAGAPRVLNFYGSQLNRISDAISVKRGELLRIKKLLQNRLGTSDTAARYHYEDMILRINTALGIK
mgnify:CR=1 FL=1